MALISFAVIAKLIRVFVFAYAKCRFSHDAAHFLCNVLEKSVLVISPQTSIHNLEGAFWLYKQIFIYNKMKFNEV